MNSETGQQLICGQGELHLEIVKDRILNHYKAKAIFGETFIAYRSTIQQPIEKTFSKSYMGGKESVKIKLKLTPGNPTNQVKTAEGLRWSDIIGSTNKKLSLDIEEALKQGAIDAFSNGCPSGFPFHELLVEISEFEMTLGTPVNTIRNAMFQAIVQTAANADPILLEPIMQISIQVDEAQLRNVLSDLTGRRRGEVNDLSQDKHQKYLKGKAPLKELLDYATALRGMTKGTGFFSMEFLEYAPPNEKIQKQILNAHGHGPW